jgi:hypothetical protein
MKYSTNLLIPLALIFSLTACQPQQINRSREIPLNWPMQPMTDVEVEEARNCDIEAFASERYSDSLGVEELSSKYAPKNACDWAVLAYACADRANGDSTMPETCLGAFREMVGDNPAFVFRNQIFLYYFGSAVVVKPPPVSQLAVTKLRVEYSWFGLGDSVEYTIDITQADSAPQVNIEPSRPFSASPEEIREIIQSMPAALTDLLPVNSPLAMTVCFDNYPSWQVSLTFEDQTVLSLTNNESNMLTAGGPWQTVIEEQNYIQFSAEFLIALDKLIQRLGLEYGQPAGMYCNADTDVLDLVYP